MNTTPLFGRLAYTLVLAATAKLAHADAIEFGAVTRCERAGAGFELGAYVQFNEQITILASKYKGTRRLPYGRQSLRCRVGEAMVVAEVGVNPPSNGECMGAGHVSLISLTYAGRKVGPVSETLYAPFNWKCTGSEPMLVRLGVRRNVDNVILDQCTAQDWKWESGYTEIKCSALVIQ